MTETTAAPQDGLVLRLTRRFAAPREAVFRAWTDPEELAKWFGPDTAEARNIRIDLRPGGAYSLELHEADGTVFPLSGVYREVRPPERLVFTWTWGAGGMAGVETLVTVEFRTAGAGTEVALTHAGLPSADFRDKHEQGWTGTLGCLDRLVEQGGLP